MGRSTPDNKEQFLHRSVGERFLDQSQSSRPFFARKRIGRRESGHEAIQHHSIDLNGLSQSQHLLGLELQRSISSTANP
jgi:hypothetical protein